MDTGRAVSLSFLADFSVSCCRVLLETLDPLALLAPLALASTCLPLLALARERRALILCSTCGPTRQPAT